jgi:uridine kinase
MLKVLSVKIGIMLLIKLVLLALFSSSYTDGFFVYFLEYSATGESYFNNHLLVYPFHTLLIYIYSFLAYIINFLNIDSTILINIIFKLPLLISDFIILYILVKAFMKYRKNIYIYYFLNPIIIYMTYINVHFTIISTALLMLTAYMLTVKKELLYSALFMGLAISSEIYMIIVLPIVFYFIYNKEDIKESIKYILLALFIFLLFNIPYLLNGEFISIVSLSLKESLDGASFNIGELKILASLSSILLVYYYFFNQKQVNEQLLYLYFGLLFTVSILFIYPRPELYVYIVPYLSIYLISHDNQEKSLTFYSLFTIFYFIFFLFFYQENDTVVQFLGYSLNYKIDNENLRDIFYTFLEVMTLIVVVAYSYSIGKNSIYRQKKNLAIGIGGDSGVGKSLLLTNLTLIFRDKLLEIEGDGEHKWERGDENWDKFTHLDPKANYIHKQAEGINELKQNRAIYRSEYDHDTGKFTVPSKLEPKDIIIISGLHPFYLPKLRKTIDIKVYMDTDETLRRHWKILRDTSKRGYSKEKILEQIATRAEDTSKYIYPQKKFADVIINYFPLHDFELGEPVDVEYGLRITFDASIHIEHILENLKVNYNWDYNEDLQTQYIELREKPKNNYTILSRNFILNVDQFIDKNARWKHGYEGFVQFMMVLVISEKLKEDR